MEDFNQQNNENQGDDDKVVPTSPSTEVANTSEGSQTSSEGFKSQSPVGNNNFNSANDPAVPAPTSTINGPTLSSPQKSNKGKKIAVILVAIFAFLALAGAAVAFLVINHINNKPEKVLADAIANTTSDLLDRKPLSTVNKVVYVSGKNKVTVDLNTLQKDKDGKLEAKVVIETEEINLDVDASVLLFGNEEAYVKVDNLKKTVDTVIDQFAKSSGAPSNQVSQMKTSLNPLVTKLDGKWLQITSADIEGLAGSTGSNVSADKCAKAAEALRISGDDKKELKKLFNENQFITASEVLDKQDAGGEKSFHYVIKVNEDPAVNFFKGAINLKSFERVVADCEINKEDIKKSESSNSSGEVEPKLELWVGSKTRRFTKIRVTSKEKTVEVDFSSELKFEEGVGNISKPSEFVTLKELQAEFEKLSSGSQGSVLGDSISL